MTIDEAITEERDNAKTQMEIAEECFREHIFDEKERIEHIRYANEFEQIADWLEELKILREKKSEFQIIARDNYEIGYNKAIDDFAEKLNAKCDGMIKEKWNNNVAPISWAAAYADFKDDIYEIAEQLKEGVS